MRGGILASAVIIILTLFMTIPERVFGLELDTRYAIVTYDTDEQLRKFNKKIRLGSLSYMLRGREAVTVEDDVINKVDVIIERVKAILEMNPRPFDITFVLLDTDYEVRIRLKTNPQNASDYIAFYSTASKTVFLSVKDTRLAVIAHECAHAVIDQYLKVSPAAKIHEVLAQYVEQHLNDD